MFQYIKPSLMILQKSSFLIKSQGSQFELLCRPELDCGALSTEPCCVADEGFSIRLGVEITDSPNPCSVPVNCDFQTSVPLNCESVTMTPVGECGDLCVYDLTCEGLSGPCPAENTVVALCEAPGT